MTDTETIKYNSDLPAVYQQITSNALKRAGKDFTGLCPFHNDTHTGNFTLYIKAGVWRYKCFACQESGDVFDFVMKALKLSFADAKNYLGGNVSLACDKAINPQKRVEIKKHDRESLTQKTTEIYEYFNSITSITKQGRDFMKSRGFDDYIINKYDIKSIDTPDDIEKALIKKFNVDDLKESGLWNNANRFLFYMPCVLFPAQHNGKPCYFSSRNYTDIKSKRFFKLAGRSQEYYTGEITGNEVVIFEAIIDALSYEQITGCDNWAVVTGLNNHIITEWAEKNKDKTFYISYDNDLQGIEASKTITAQNVKMFDYSIFTDGMGIESTDFKDMNDILKLQKSFVNDLSVIDREAYEERAGIMEYDAHLHMGKAEYLALVNILNRGKYEEIINAT